MKDSREIIEIFEDIVKETSKDCVLVVPDYKGGFREIACPSIHYVFGNAKYVKDRLDELSKTPKGNEMKFPLIALWTPFKEERNTPDYYSKAKVNILIACSSKTAWNNEERRLYSFEGVLRPIYRRLLEAIADDRRIAISYDEVLPHEYSENYTYGRYGAQTPTGDEVSESIDAINISNLELKIKLPNCR